MVIWWVIWVFWDNATTAGLSLLLPTESSIPTVDEEGIMVDVVVVVVVIVIGVVPEPVAAETTSILLLLPSLVTVLVVEEEESTATTDGDVMEAEEDKPSDTTDDVVDNEEEENCTFPVPVFVREKAAVDRDTERFFSSRSIKACISSSTSGHTHANPSIYSGSGLIWDKEGVVVVVVVVVNDADGPNPSVLPSTPGDDTGASNSNTGGSKDNEGMVECSDITLAKPASVGDE